MQRKFICVTWLAFNGHLPTSVAKENSELLNFLHWYPAAGNAPNISILGMQGGPSGRGWKDIHPEQTISVAFVTVNKSIPTTRSQNPLSQAHSLQ